MSSVSVEDGMIVAQMTFDDARSLTVALQPCLCRATKSIGTEGIRARLAMAITRKLAQVKK